MPVKCTHEGCGKSFSWHSSLKAHIRTHIKRHIRTHTARGGGGRGGAHDGGGGGHPGGGHPGGGGPGDYGPAPRTWPGSFSGVGRSLV